MCARMGPLSLVAGAGMATLPREHAQWDCRCQALSEYFSHTTDAAGNVAIGSKSKGKNQARESANAPLRKGIAA